MKKMVWFDILEKYDSLAQIEYTPVIVKLLKKRILGVEGIEMLQRMVGKGSAFTYIIASAIHKI